MPRKTEIQAEEAIVGSPLRRSSRINMTANPPALNLTTTKNAQSTPDVLESKGPKMRRASLSQENGDKDDKKENKPAPRGRRGSTAKDETEQKPEPAKTRTRRSSATTEPPTKTEEPKPIPKRRRSSATEELPERETLRPLRSRRGSTADQPEEDTDNKHLKGKRTSAKEETVNDEPVRKPVRSRRGSAADKTEDNAEIGVEKEKKRPARGRRASTDKLEDEPETKSLKLTPSKSKRRLSVTENVVSLEPIEEHESETKGRKSSSPVTTDLKVILKASATSVTTEENRQPLRETRSTRSTPVKSRRQSSVTENVDLEPIEEQELETKGRKSTSPTNPELKVILYSPAESEVSEIESTIPTKSRRLLSFTEMAASKSEPTMEELEMKGRKSGSPIHSELKIVVTPSEVSQLDKQPAAAGSRSPDLTGSSTPALAEDTHAPDLNETDKIVKDGSKDIGHGENQMGEDSSPKKTDGVEKVVSLTPVKKSRSAEVKTNSDLSIIEENSFVEEHSESRPDKRYSTSQSPRLDKVNTSPETLRRSPRIFKNTVKQTEEKDDVKNSVVVEEDKVPEINANEINNIESTKNNREFEKSMSTTKDVEMENKLDSSLKDDNINNTEVNDGAPITKVDFPDISTGSDGSFRFHLNISLPSSNSHNMNQNDSVDVEDVNTSKMSNSSDKENMDINCPTNPTMELQYQEKVVDVSDLTSINNVNENKSHNTVNRISNVFRPKMKENSFVEPMDVDEFPSILSTTQNKFPLELDESNVDNVPPAKSTPIATRSIHKLEKELSIDPNTHIHKIFHKDSSEVEDESVDDSFKLSLSITQQEEQTYVADVKNEVTIDFECIEVSKVIKATLIETEKIGEESVIKNEPLLNPKDEEASSIQETKEYPVNDFEHDPLKIDGKQKEMEKLIEQTVTDCPQHILFNKKLEEDEDMDIIKSIVIERYDITEKDTQQIAELNSYKQAGLVEVIVGSYSASNPEDLSKICKSPEPYLGSDQTEHLSKSPCSVSCQFDLNTSTTIPAEKEVSREKSASFDGIAGNVEEMKSHSPKPKSLEPDGYKVISENQPTKIDGRLENSMQHLPQNIPEIVDEETDKSDNRQLETNPMSQAQPDSDLPEEGQQSSTRKMDVSDEYEFDVPSDEEIEKTQELGQLGNDESHLEQELVATSPSKRKHGSTTNCKETKVSLEGLEDNVDVGVNESSPVKCKKIYSQGENVEEKVDEQLGKPKHVSIEDLVSHTVESLQQTEANGVCVTKEPEDSSTASNYKNSEKVSVEEEIPEVHILKESEYENTSMGCPGNDQNVNDSIEIEENTVDKKKIKASINSAFSNSVSSETESVKDTIIELEDMENDFKDVVQDHKEQKTGRRKSKSKKSKKTAVICEHTTMDDVQKESDEDVNDIEESTNFDCIETKGDTEARTDKKLKKLDAELVEEFHEGSSDSKKSESSETDVSFKGKRTKRSKKKKEIVEDNVSVSYTVVDQDEYSTTGNSGSASSNLVIQIKNSERDAVEMYAKVECEDTSDKMKTKRSGHGNNKKGKRKSETTELSTDTDEIEKFVLENPKQKRKLKKKTEIFEESETNDTKVETHVKKSPVTVNNDKETDDDSDDAMINETDFKSIQKSNPNSDVSKKRKINLGDLENFAKSKLDEYLSKKMSEIDSTHESISDEESEKEENEFLCTMAEEGEEDTPSEGSNDIIDEGESINSTESELDSDDDYDENDSFISDGEEIKLLSGDEYDLDDAEPEKKKSRIIQLDDYDDEVIKIKRKEKPVIKKKSRIITISDSSDSEGEKDMYEELREHKDSETNENVDSTPQSPEQPLPEEKSKQDDDVIILEESWPTKSPLKPATSETCSSILTASTSEDDQPQKNKRKSSITIHENINVSEIKDAALSERITNLVDTFCTSMRKGEISMNLSLEYAAKDSSENSPAATEEQVEEPEKMKIKTSKKHRKSSSLSDEIFEPEEKTSQIETKASKRRRRRRKSAHKKDIEAEENVSVSYSSEEGTSSKRTDRLSVTLDNIEDSDDSSKKSKKRRISKSLENLNEGLTKKKNKVKESWKKELVSKKKNVSPRRNQKKIKRVSSPVEDLRIQTYSIMNQLITDVKKKPTRTILPSREVTDMNSSWITEIADVRPSTTIVSRRERTEYKLMNNIHPKDFRSQMLYDSSRVKRVDTKTLLKKRGAYF